MDRAVAEAIISEDYESEHRELLSSVIQMGFDFVLGRRRRSRFIRYRTPEQIGKLYESNVPLHGKKLAELISDDLATIADLSVSKGDPRYIAFPDSANSITSQVANVLSGFLNQNMITFERGAPSATYVERQLLRWHRQLIGYGYVPTAAEESLTDVGGMITSGGNASNLIALAAALHREFPEARIQGISGLTKKPLIYVPAAVEHFSYETAACLLGIGESSIRYVKVDHNYRTSMEDLSQNLGKIAPDEQPVAIAVYAGNTRTSSIDPLNDAADIAEKYGSWLHVDACHGGSLLFRDDHRAMLSGISRADSVSIDPHKTMLCTYPLSLVLFKDGRDLARIGRSPDKALDPNNIDLGQMAPLYGSRGFESLKAWLVIKNLGTDGLAKMAQERMRLARIWHGMLADSEMFVPLHKPDMYKIAFVAMPSNIRQLADRLGRSERGSQLLASLADIVDAAGSKIANRLYEAGSVCVDKFWLQDTGKLLGLPTTPRLVLGSVIANPAISEDTLTIMLADMTTAARQVYSELKPQVSAIESGQTTNSRNALMRDVGSSPASWAGGHHAD